MHHIFTTKTPQENTRFRQKPQQKRTSPRLQKLLQQMPSSGCVFASSSGMRTQLPPHPDPPDQAALTPKTANLSTHPTREKSFFAHQITRHKSSLDIPLI
jgi:hypothetical protein